MKPQDAETDAYGLAFVEARTSLLKTTANLPWVDIKLEYDALYQQVWIWVLLGDVEQAQSAYDCLVKAFRILDINEARCELNLSFLCKLPFGKTGHIADLSGKQDVIDFHCRQVSENDMIVNATEPTVFSGSN